MPSDHREPGRPSPGGIGKLTAATLGTVADYFHIRIQLLLLEAREAGGEFGQRALLLGFGLLCLVIGYVSLVIAFAAWLSRALEWSLLSSALAVAGGHLLLGVASLLLGRRKFKHSPFRDTLLELERDRQWLKNERS